MNILYLIGPRASGKTSVARRLAELFCCDFYDTDLAFVDTAGENIAAFVAKNGWEAFRRQEKEVLRSLVADYRNAQSACIATGGGIVLDPENRELLKATGLVAYLKVPEKILVERLRTNPSRSQRPDLTSRGLTDEVHKVLAEREPLYRSCANFTVDGSVAIDQVCESIIGQVSAKFCTA